MEGHQEKNRAASHGKTSDRAPREGVRGDQQEEDGHHPKEVEFLWPVSHVVREARAAVIGDARGASGKVV